MEKKYNAAFIGCGRRAQQFAQGVKNDPRLVVTALADPSREAADKMAADFGWKAEVFTDYKDMLSKARPEVVFGALWTILHLPVFRDCADAGVKSYLSEKPMAASWADSLSMAKISEESGCQLTFCHQRRFAKRNRVIRKLVADGVFGKIERLDLYASCSLLDCGTHSIDQALSYLGDIPAKKVICAVDTAKQHKSFGVPVESAAAGMIMFDDGVGASIASNCKGFQDLWGGVRLIGSKGIIEAFWAGEVRRAVLFDDSTWRFPDPGAEQEGEEMSRLVSEVLDCLESGTESDISYKKALRTTEIIFALYESARKRAIIELPLMGEGNFMELFQTQNP